MPRLSDENRNQLISKAKNVYFSYLRLEILNRFDIKDKNGNNTTVKKLLEQQLSQEELQPIEFSIGNRTLKLEIGEDKQISFSDVNAGKGAVPEPKFEVKDLAKYTSDDIADQLIASSITYYGKQEVKFSTPLIGEKFSIGGPDKIDLYKLHVSNLGKIIQHLESKHCDANMLVSLTTGSGKTFTQALFMMVLELAKLNGVFGVPEALVNQFKEDLKRLLPEQIIEKLEGEDSHIIIDSVDNILLRPTPKQKSFDSSTTIYSFDEAHLMAKLERLFLKAKEIASQFVCLYLTATPTTALTEIAKGESKKESLRVVATMNNQQKVANQYAEPVESFAKSAKSIEEMGSEAGISRSQKIQRWLADAVDKETGFNAANAFAEAYLYSISTKPLVKNSEEGDEVDSYWKLRQAARWNVQLSAFGGKTLVCANHFEDIVNLDTVTKETMENVPKIPRLDGAGPSSDAPSAPKLSHTVYTRGNKFTRDETYQFLQVAKQTESGLTHTDSEIFEAYENKRYQQFQSHLEKELNQVSTGLGINASKIAVSNLAAEMTSGLSSAPITNSMHAVIDLALSILASGSELKVGDLAGILQNFGGAYLDKQRFDSLEKFGEQIATRTSNLVAVEGLEEKLKTFLQYDAKHNPRGIDEASAGKLANLLFEIMIEMNARGGIAKKNLHKLIDNWTADQSVFAILGDVTDKLYKFSKAHYKRFVFNQVEKNETIKPNEVFSSFKEDVHQVGIAKEEDDYKAKTRAKRAVEALNPEARESVFTPTMEEGESQDLEITDNFFRLGITTLYCNDQKIAGFNDQNLHQVAVLAYSDENHLANPANIIQAYGRNRGLNPYKIPNFFLISQKGVECIFGVDDLNKDDYQKDYEKANVKFKKNSIKKIGNQLGEMILEWIEKNKNPLHEVNDEQLAEAVIQYCFDTLEKLNQANAFNFKLAEKDYAKVLGQAIGFLKQQEKSLKTGTVLPFLVRVVAALMHTVANIFKRSARKEPERELNDLMKAFDDGEEKSLEDHNRVSLYKKITTLDLEKVWQNDMAGKLIKMNVFSELKNIKDIRDKYYSLPLLKPLDLLSTENKNTIKTQFPELKTVMEGLFSVLALSTIEDKENILKQLGKIQDQSTLTASIQSILNATLNPDHPEIATQLPRIHKMLSLLGYSEEEIPKELEALQDLLKSKRTEIALVGVAFKNRDGMQFLTYTDEKVNDKINDLKCVLLDDIKKLVDPLISDPAYLEMLLFIKNNFKKQEITTFLSEVEQNADDLLTYIDAITLDKCDFKDNKDKFYKEYFLPILDSENPSAEDISNMSFITRNITIDMIFKIMHEANLKFYKVDEHGQAKDPTDEDNAFFHRIDASDSRIDIMTTPSLEDKDDKGRTWRQILGLDTLKTSIPTINRMNYIVKQKEIKKAMEVSEKMLAGISKRKDDNFSSNSLQTYSSLFSKVIKEESHQTGAPLDLLAGKNSRVEKMQSQFENEKYNHFNFIVDSDVKERIVGKMKEYIDSRLKVKGQIDPDNIKSINFFNQSLTLAKLNLAAKFINKLEKLGNNYSKILQLIDTTVAENSKLLDQYGKKKERSHEFVSTLNQIRSILVDAKERNLGRVPVEAKPASAAPSDLTTPSAP